MFNPSGQNAHPMMIVRPTAPRAVRLMHCELHQTRPHMVSFCQILRASRMPARFRRLAFDYATKVTVTVINHIQTPVLFVCRCAHFRTGRRRVVAPQVTAVNSDTPLILTGWSQAMVLAILVAFPILIAVKVCSAKWNLGPVSQR